METFSKQQEDVNLMAAYRLAQASLFSAETRYLETNNEDNYNSLVYWIDEEERLRKALQID